MKIKPLIVLTTVFLILFSACNFKTQTVVLPTGKYVMVGAVEEEWAWISLEAGDNFVFNRNLSTSYRPMGSYAVDQDVLTLTVNDTEKYIFKIQDQRLVFQSGRLAEGLLQIGTVFERQKE